MDCCLMWSALKRSWNDSKHLYIFTFHIGLCINTHFALLWIHKKKTLFGAYGTDRVRWERKLTCNWRRDGCLFHLACRALMYSNEYESGPWQSWGLRSSKHRSWRGKGVMRSWGYGNCAHSSKPKLGACFSIEHTQVCTNNKLVCVYKQKD